MPFKLVYDSQQDAQWKNEILGCALTGVRLLISGHGYTETPKSLNQKLRNLNGFAGAAASTAAP